jgi:polyisoprenoid-binding protein YceI
MIRLHLAGLMLCAALAGMPARAAPAVYTLDTERSSVHFEVLHFGTSTLRARLGAIAGTVTLDRAAGKGEVNLRLPTTGVDTGAAVFNARLREPDMLASSEFPDAYFIAAGLRFEGGQLAEVRGEFTLRGVSRALTLRAVRFACSADGAKEAEVCGGDFEGRVLRSDFGMNYGLPFIADEVRLLVAVVGRRR